MNKLMCRFVATTKKKIADPNLDTACPAGIPCKKKIPDPKLDDNRSRDRYNVELRFKVYYISAGQTSLLQVQ